MDANVDSLSEFVPFGGDPELKDIPPVILATFGVCVFWVIVFLVYVVFLISAPVPRTRRQSERTYSAIFRDGSLRSSLELPSWFERWRAIRQIAKREGKSHVEELDDEIEDGSRLFSIVVPAYNEAQRLPAMLKDTVTYLQSHYSELRSIILNSPSRPYPTQQGWEILVVSDGSNDGTDQVALDFAREYSLFDDCDPSLDSATGDGTIRVISLAQNGGKGGAVRHGLKFVRGQYVLFADADGASPFENFKDLLIGCLSLAGQENSDGCAFAIGSRAHLVKTDSVAKRSFLRNILMRTFHLVLKTLTPPETANIQDTQCGFKLLTRPALPFIVPFVHFEGWIFDVEMLMLAERAGIPMGEYAVRDWKEIQGSKLNVLFDSIEMAWNLIVLRGAWMLGVYRIESRGKVSLDDYQGSTNGNVVAE